MGTLTLKRNIEDMFDKETYIRRRAELKKLVGEGVIVLFGNNEAPCNYPANAYAPMRQDSSFLYYFGQHRDGLVGVIDIDNDEEWLFGDDIDVEDIVWMGFTPTVSDLAAEVGITKTAPMSHLTSYIKHVCGQICCCNKNALKIFQFFQDDILDGVFGLGATAGGVFLAF